MLHTLSARPASAVFRKLPVQAAFFALAMAGLSACGSASNAQTAARTDDAIKAAGMNGKDKAAVEAIVHDYILENPEIITEAVQVLQQRRTLGQLNAVRNQIETPFASAWTGNPNGDVTIVEYSDYACGYCAQSVADVEKLVAGDKNVKVVFRELPILSDESTAAAKMALAAAKQGKFNAFHTGLYAMGKPTDASIDAAARKAGLDIAKAKNFASSSAANEEIQNNLTIAQQLSFSGTPSWVIGERTYSGALGLEGLRDAVAKARAAKAKN